MKRSMLVTLPLLLLLSPGGVAAQEYDVDELPRDVEQRVRRELSDPTTIRLEGPERIPADSSIAGDLVVRGGDLTLAGRVVGDVIVLGGDLVLEPGATITGDAIVVGGAARGVEDARLGGTLMTYAEADPYALKAEREDRDRRDRDHRRRHRDRRDRDDRDDRGGLDLSVGVSSNYNRVEGLPLMVGPVIETGGRNHTRLEGLAIWRTEPSRTLEDSEEIGYRIRLEQALYGGRLHLGGQAHSQVVPIEERGLGSVEAGLAALLFHSDLHDYHHTEGWSAWLRWSLPALRVSGRVDYRDEEHHELAVSDPWTLFGDDPWRAQPFVAEGDIGSVGGLLRLDTRNDEEHATRGWYTELAARHPVDMDLAMPALEIGGMPVIGFEYEAATVGRVDLRRYTPVHEGATLNLRVLAQGALQDEALPPQMQQALGGPGTLPAYGLFDGDCGARRTSGTRLGTPVDQRQPMFLNYGCDRTLLAQLEYRGGLFLGWDWDDDDDDEDDDRDDDHRHDWDDWQHWDLDLDADWVFFADAGWGWVTGDIAGREDTDAMYDVGLGVILGDLGVYGAVPLTGDDRSLRVIARLERRF